MGYVTVTEFVGEVSKSYHFESYDDFKDWENKISGVLVSAPEIDEEGWIENTYKYPDLDGKTYVDVKFLNGETSNSQVEDWSWDHKNSAYEITHYRVVSK